MLTKQLSISIIFEYYVVLNLKSKDMVFETLLYELRIDYRNVAYI